ncbi:MAG: hypothetical protein FWE41_00585 [Coriobacteriia bacterium]|nr:hypothetical protein [Coriobacteriia bacterium]MCL2750813.1 hypothetical protein [Coriobacteriia bacterium]
MTKIASRIVLCLAACLFLACASGCALINNYKPQPPKEPITGDYVVIEDVENSRYYLIDNPADLEDLFPVLPSAVFLKEVSCHYIYVIEDGFYKTYFPYFKDTSLYESWGEETPYDLIEQLGRLLSAENEVSHFTFLAEDPAHYVALMDRLSEEEGLHFYYPSLDTDERFSYVMLSYDCTDMNLDRVVQAPIGTFSVDDVFIPVVEYLEERGLLYKECDVRFIGSSNQYFGRGVQLLVNKPLTRQQMTEISQLMQNSTNKEPYLDGDKPSGRASYIEKTPYSIEMITKKDFSENDIAALKEKYNLEAAG